MGNTSTAWCRCRDRIHVYDWCEDYEKYLAISDIYLDTYPSGGGFTLFDAALSHIPIISFSDDITKEFDQCEWNIAQELMSKESVILVDRYNIMGIKNVIRRLYYDIDYRKYIGNRGYEYVTDLRKGVRNNVKKIEELYIRLVNDLL